jgi:hypothetical protein
MQHLAILHNFPANLHTVPTLADAAKSFKKAVRKNHLLYGRRLFKVGATSCALKQLQITAHPRDTRQFTITEENLPRMDHFLRQNPGHNFLCLRFAMQMAVRVFAACQHDPDMLGRQRLPIFLSVIQACRDRVDGSSCFQRIAAEMSE